MSIPLPCFGLEYLPHDPVCQSCPHQTGCIKFMGSRAGKIELSKLTFNLMPPGVRPKAKVALNFEDPELPHLERLYADCYQTIFRDKPKDNLSRYRDEIVKAARECATSLRMFILSNMVGHQVHQHTLMEHTERSTPRPFTAKLLSGKLARTRCEKYGKLCNKEYGTFSLTSLSTLVDEDYEKDDLSTGMLNSEITAGKFIVSYKINHGGPPYEALYEHEEFGMNQYWLAIEPSYQSTILDAHRVKPSGSEAIRCHRYDVIQTIGYLHRNRKDQSLVFAARERIMPQAVRHVLSFFHHQPTDFLIEDAPITDPLKLWIQIGRAIQHYQCFLFLQGEPSFYARRSTGGSSSIEVGEDDTES